jgi:hypothetical protein
MTNEELVSSLRELADFYEQHPTLPVPYDLENPSGMFVFFYGIEDSFKQVLKEIGSFKKEFGNPSPEDFCAIKQVGSLKLRLHTKRETVCTPRVVGKRVIKRHVIPEQIVEAHEEEIVEWDCEPVMAEER